MRVIAIEISVSLHLPKYIGFCTPYRRGGVYFCEWSICTWWLGIHRRSASTLSKPVWLIHTMNIIISICVQSSVDGAVTGRRMSRVGNQFKWLHPGTVLYDKRYTNMCGIDKKSTIQIYARCLFRIICRASYWQTMSVIWRNQPWRVYISNNTFL